MIVNNQSKNCKNIIFKNVPTITDNYYKLHRTNNISHC